MATEFHWVGASGAKYVYWGHALPYSCDPDQPGNYIFCKLVGDRWQAVYIGQGDINDRVNDPEHFACATQKGATHVHVHTNPSEAARLAEEDDLLASNPGSYAPTGCNERKLEGSKPFC